MADDYAFWGTCPTCVERRPFKQLDRRDGQGRVVMECMGCGQKIALGPPAAEAGI